MSYVKPLALGTLLACLALAPGAFAQSDTQGGSMQTGGMQDNSMHMHGRMMGHGEMSKMFDAMDTNHDGYVSEAEHTAYMDAMFKQADANGDGKLSRDEMRNAVKQHHREMDAMQH
ncbi:MAG TPA: EF-hand domain-containing protein [Rhodanobacteraceae bacterium]|jgi:Ca2+-binding EF-hand superfamily protein